MKTLSFGDNLAFLRQHVFHFHVFDDYKKKGLLEIIRRIRKSWHGALGFFLKLIVNCNYIFYMRTTHPLVSPKRTLRFRSSRAGKSYK